MVIPEADTLIVVLFRRAGGGAKGASLFELESELEGILYHLSSSSLSLLERLAKESIGSDLSLDNPKLGKSNKSDFIVKIKGEWYSYIIRFKQSEVLCFLIKLGFLSYIYL